MVRYYHGTHWDLVGKIARSRELLAPIEVEAQQVKKPPLNPDEREALLLKRCLLRYAGYASTHDDLEGKEYLGAVRIDSERNHHHPYHRIMNISVSTRVEQAEMHTSDRGIILELDLDAAKVNGIYVPR